LKYFSFFPDVIGKADFTDPLPRGLGAQLGDLFLPLGKVRWGLWIVKEVNPIFLDHDILV
jgi:hypothetical protein